MEAVRWGMETGRGNRFCSPWQRTGCWVSEMGSCWKILYRGVKWSDLNFKRILLWESLATILRIDCKRKRVELGRQVSRLVACEMTVELTSEERLDLGCLSRGDWRDLLMRVDMGWERGIKDDFQSFCSRYLENLNFHLPRWEDREEQGGGEGSKTCVLRCVKVNLRRHPGRERLLNVTSSLQVWRWVLQIWSLWYENENAYCATLYTAQKR